MAFANFNIFQKMVDKAFRQNYAFPAVNVHDIFTLNGVIEGFAAAESDGIVQIYPDAAASVSGALGDPVLGAVTLAEHAHRLAERYEIAVALHTDHCSKEMSSTYLLPLIRETEKRRQKGEPNLFTSHMFDGSALSLDENLKLSKEMLQICKRNELWLEVEIGIIGAENAETSTSPGKGGAKKLYTSGEDFLAVYEAFKDISREGFLVAPAFGNTHGVYKPGEVSLQPEILKECQDVLSNACGGDSRFRLVFHGGSGSSDGDIRKAVRYGVVKMNFDTDGQYAFTRKVVDYMFKNYDRVLRIDGEVGVKLSYFAETWLSEGSHAVSEYVSQLCEKLGSAGKSVGNE